MNAAEEMVVGAARQAAERDDATAIEASLLIVVDNQQAAIQRVRQLHRTGPGEPTPGGSICWCCGHPWPCLTIRALDGDGDG